MAFLGFVLTKIFGSQIVHQYQLRAHKLKISDKRLDDQMQMATEVFEEISSLMDRRLYLERKLLYSHKDVKLRGLPDKTQDRFDEYNKFLYEWNSRMNINICKVEQFYGAKLKTLLQDRIMKDFNWIGILLRRLHLQVDNIPSFEAINKSIDVTNERVYKIDQQMLKCLKSQNVGSFRNVD
ncbi:hypothetical protein ABMA77_08750 [Halobacteriovorax sp. RZ-1]|uniref:hypothetical protein n=1 Tax=unclassified Halobacteriovorax TaxID=2639665 RepID=UPI0037174A81